MVRPWSPVPGTLVPAILKGRLRATASTPLSRTKTFDGSGDSRPADVIRRRGGAPSRVDTSLILGSRASHGRLFVCPAEGRKTKTKMMMMTMKMTMMMMMKKAGSRRPRRPERKEADVFLEQTQWIESEERVGRGGREREREIEEELARAVDVSVMFSRRDRPRVFYIKPRADAGRPIAKRTP